MLLLDTNVLSAIMQKLPPAAVDSFIAAQPVSTFYTTTICQAEILAGIAILPPGRRRDESQTAAAAVFLDAFSGRVLVFDERAATAYSEVFSMRRRAGRPAGVVDMMIAAVARAHGASVVTRDTGGFDGCGLIVIDPWSVDPRSVPG